jgi:hypothetical protein
MDGFTAFFSSLEPTLIPLGAIVTLVVISLIRGWLVPRSVLQERIADKDRQIEALAKERDDWKAAYHVSVESRLEVVRQNGELIDGAETTNRLIESLRNYIERINPLPPSDQRQVGGS